MATDDIELFSAWLARAAQAPPPARAPGRRIVSTARAPITKQRSPWQHLPGLGLAGGEWFARRVHDGELRACVADEDLGWHLSISFQDHRGRPSRYPTWDEIAHARDELLPLDIAFVMHLPVVDEYVAVHPTCFHIHEHPARTA